MINDLEDSLRERFSINEMLARITALEAEMRELKARVTLPQVDIVGISKKTAIELLQEKFPGAVPCKE